jgi:hypothetical protein
MILNNKVFVPLYGISSDSTAIATYEAAMPGYEVFGYEGSWLSDDAIHCRTMEIPDRYMLVVDTNPLQDRGLGSGDYRVAACVDDRSEAGLVNDSLLVYWRLEGSPGFSAVAMQATAYPDSYYADIPRQPDSVNVEYYVFAKDLSGRRSTRPPVAPSAWYTFNTGRDLSRVVDAGEAPSGFRLAQNSPNPFVSTTEIRYELPVGCHVRLEVYNVLGKHVATLVDEYQPAGSVSLRWDARAGASAFGSDRYLPGGVYFCTLRAGCHTETRKLVLLN